MGKHTTRKPRPLDYTTAECAILTQHYASAPREALLADCPGRSWPGLKKVAQRLGLSRPSPKYWSPEHLDSLRTHYATDGAKAVQAATGRALSSIYDKASELGLVHEPKPSPPKPAPAARPAPSHNPGRKATNTLAPLRIVGAATRTNAATPNLNLAKAAKATKEKASKGPGIVAQVNALPANSEGRRIYLLAGRQGGAAATAAFLAWKATQPC